MKCVKPISAYRAVDGSVVFAGSKKETVSELKLRCGQCIGCRLDRSLQWAVRCMHEASLHDGNSYITLTYSDECLPEGGKLNYRDFQLFMKRLRKRYPDVRIPFFMCGEYGGLRGRPHFHACLFNLFFDDRYEWRKFKGNQLYRSPTLEKLWCFGDSTIGDVTFESAAYVARYVVDKLTGDGESEYSIINVESGEVYTRPKEFAHMSLRPAIGADWLRLYWQELSDGRVIMNGRECSIPRYYRKVMKRLDMSRDLEEAAEIYAHEVRADNTPARLAVEEVVLKSRMKSFQRNLGE